VSFALHVIRLASGHHNLLSQVGFHTTLRGGGGKTAFGCFNLNSSLQTLDPPWQQESTKRESSFGMNPMYKVRVTGRKSMDLFAQEIGFIQRYKAQKLAESLGTTKAGTLSLRIPFFPAVLARHCSLSHHACEDVRLVPTSAKALRGLLPKTDTPTREKAVEIAKLIPGLWQEAIMREEFVFMRVVSNTEVDIEHVTVDMLNAETSENGVLSNGFRVRSIRRDAGKLANGHWDVGGAMAS
jgi:hypothetical protein